MKYINIYVVLFLSLIVASIAIYYRSKESSKVNVNRFGLSLSDCSDTCHNEALNNKLKGCSMHDFHNDTCEYSYRNCMINTCGEDSFDGLPDDN